jgi:hypothetical protein
MKELQLDTYGTVTLDSSGNGTVRIGPPSGVMWKPEVVSIFTSTATLFPVCNIYVGGSSSPGQRIDGTYTGNQNSTTNIAGSLVYHGQYVWAVWTGGDVGAVATLSIVGKSVVGYRDA